MPRSTHNPDYILFREFLRSVRLEAGLTQVDVARNLGVHQSYVSKYESGERRLDVIELRAIGIALGVPIATLIRRLERVLPQR